MESRCFQQQLKIGVDIEIYQARSGTAMGRWIWRWKMGNGEVESVHWFLRTMLMVLFAVGGVEANLGLPIRVGQN
jgi:hypothetical protein